jgi:ABC-type bacteriocin/lantibiotic exporter with double-glycine peptidase domain
MRTCLLLLAGVCCAATLWAAESGHWIDVPFIQQPREGCGAATLSMVMQYWEQQLHRPSTPNSQVEEIQRALYRKEAHGIYASQLTHYLEQQGYTAYVVHGDEALLAHHIEQGRPLIVALRPAHDPLLHYVVVSGVQPDQQLVLINDPAQRKLLKVDSRDFEQEWKATGNWTLLALPRSSS